MTDQLAEAYEAGRTGDPAVSGEERLDHGAGDQAATRWQVRLAGGERVSVLVRASAINLLVNDESPSYTFDPLGRLHGAFIAGVNYRRSLDNRVLSKWAERNAGGRERRRRWLTHAEAQAWVSAAHDLVRRVAERADRAPRPVRAALDRLQRWDWPALEADRQRFQQIYTPVGILPPDQYLALVLQATHGCSHNACTFCTFYRDVPFRIKTPEEFRQHIAAVWNFFGPALAMRRSIFLADANALVAPMGRLRELLEVLSEGQRARFSEYQTSAVELLPHAHRANRAHHPRDSLIAVPLTSDSPSSIPLTSDPLVSLPLFAFIDAFHVGRKSVADWQDLAQHGLRRVYIGMESGHDPLLRWLNKPGDADDVLEAVTTLKAAGVQVSVIIMLGVGGDRFAAGHVADTVRLLNAMPLGRGDLIYFSDFVEQPTAPYAALAAASHVHPLDAAAKRAQEAAMRAGFRPRHVQHPPQFSRYDIEEFIY